MITRLLILWGIIGNIVFLKAQHEIVTDNILFQDSIVNMIHVEVEDNDLAEILAQPDQRVEKKANIIFVQGSRRDTIPYTGFRLKGQTSRFNPKKSYKLSFDAYEKDRKYSGVKKLSINAYWNDPSHLRPHMAGKLYREMGVVACRSAFSELYINGEYVGFFNLVEHIDEEFLMYNFACNEGNLYKVQGGSLSWFGDDPDSYGMEATDTGIYRLKTNKKKADFSGLIHFIEVLNNTPDEDFECAIREVFNVEDFIKMAAVDVFTANWDGYIINRCNYYLYENPLTQKIDFIPYDLDNTFGLDWIGIDWADREVYNYSKREITLFDPEQYSGLADGEYAFLNNINSYFQTDTLRPLYTRILNVPEFRDYFSWCLGQLLEKKVHNHAIIDEIDGYFEKLYPYIVKDEYDNYSPEEVRVSIDSSLDKMEHFSFTDHLFLPYGFKEFIRLNSQNIEKQLEEKEPPLLVGHIGYKPYPDKASFILQVWGAEAKEIAVFVHPLSGTDRKISLEDTGLSTSAIIKNHIYSGAVNDTPGQLKGIHLEITDIYGKKSRIPCAGEIPLKE